jgi:TP901 family phage tail tape measure protein
MALGTREMLLVIRARDEASRVLGRLSQNMRDVDTGAAQAARDSMARGGALVSLGAGITAVGGAGLMFFNSMIDSAVAYDQSARKALTQADSTTVSLQRLKDVGRAVAEDIPVAFDQTQDALYDIFSTIDTDMPGAEKLLRAFSRAAVGGQIDLQTATQGTLQVMNAFKISTNDVGHANDVLFQLVRKGVGTYDQFVKAIGRASPSAVRAGQDVETLAGMMAFMTRNGLSTAQAATSAARALDLISNSKVGGRLKEFGVAVRDARGEFRPMSDIVSDLSDKLKGMTAPERAEALANLFAGSGNNVQARRFFDLVVTDDQALTNLTKTMRNSSGVMDKAYDTMFNSPQSKMQLMNNRYEAMKTVIGDQLIPIKLKLMEAISKLLGWWNDLSPGVQKAIVIFAVASSAIAVLVGIVIMLAGAFIMMAAAVVIADVALLPIILTILAVIAAIAAIGVAIYFIIKYWDEIVAATKAAWNWIVDILQTAWDAVWGVIGEPLKAMVQWFKDRWSDVVSFFSELWQRLIGPLQSGWDDLSAVFQKGVDYIRGKIDDFIKKFQDIWTSIKPVRDELSDIFSTIWAFISAVWGHVIEFFQATAPIWESLWNLIKAALQNVWKAIQGILSIALDILIGFWNAVVDVLSNLWTAFTSIFGGILDFLGGIIGFFVDLFTGQWGKLWDDFLGILKGLWGVIRGVLHLIAAPFIALWDILGGVWHGIMDAIQTFVQMFLNAFGPILDFFVNLGKNLWEAIKLVWNIASDAMAFIRDLAGNLLGGFIDGLKNFWHNITEWFSDAFGGLIDWFMSFFGIASPSKMFTDFGMNLLIGLLNGIKAAWNWVWDYVKNFPGNFLRGFSNIGSWLLDKGSDLLNGMLNGIKAGAEYVWNWIRNFPGNFIRGLGNIGGLLLGVGKDLLTGLWSGISGATQWLLNKVGDFFGNLLPGWARKILGIKSPSTVFAEMGKLTMMGFANGIGAGTDVALSAVANAAAAISGTFNNGLGFNSPAISGFSAGYTATPNATGTTGAAGTTVVPIIINTQEINPVQHAAELGTLIVNRVG